MKLVLTIEADTAAELNEGIRQLAAGNNTTRPVYAGPPPPLEREDVIPYRGITQERDDGAAFDEVEKAEVVPASTKPGKPPAASKKPAKQEPAKTETEEPAEKVLDYQKDVVPEVLKAAEAHGKTGIIRVTTDNPAKTKSVLKKAGFDVSDFEMVVVRLKNKPGELARLTRELADNCIDIKNAYQFPASKSEVVFGFETSNVQKAKKIAASFS